MNGVFDYEGAFTLLTFEVPLPGEFQNGISYRCPAHIVNFAKLVLGRNLRAHRPLVGGDLFLDYIAKLNIELLMIFPVD